MLLAQLLILAQPAAEAASAAPLAAIPSGFFTVIDQNGPNDYPNQDDMTRLGRDDSDPSLYQLFWSWDDVDYTGQSGEACALFDFNGNGNVDAVVCGQIANGTGWSAANPIVWQTTLIPSNFPPGVGSSPFVFRCVDSAPDRCAQPSAPQAYPAGAVTAGTLGDLSASPPANLVTNTDPFPTGTAYPNDSTLRVDISKAYLATLAGNLGNKYPAISNPDPTLVNVCSFPSAANGGNNDPKDCINTPGGGYLVIKKDAGADTTTPFNFAVSPVPAGVLSTYTINGTGQTLPIGVTITSAESVTETLPPGWILGSASCKLADGTTSTGTLVGTGVTGITIESGHVTTCTFTNIVPTPSLSLTKSATESSFDAAGDVLHYTLVATNDGNVALSGVSISDSKLGTLTCTPAQPATLAPAATLSCTGTYTTTQADVDAGKVDNTANAAGTFGTVPVTAQPASVSVPAVQSPHLTLAKTATPSFSTPVKVGDTISYQLVATNDGNVTLTGVSISDSLLPSLTCTPAQPATLAPGGTLTCTGSHTLTQADIDAGKVDNTGVADSDQTSPTEAPNEVSVPQAPALSIEKKATEATFVKAGDTLHYSYLVTNSGNVTLSGPFTVSDDKATNESCPDTASLAPGASITCTASYTVTQADLDAGSVTNVASASNGKVTSPTDTVTVNATQSPKLSLTKSASPPTYNAVGQTITYTFVVKNTGNVALVGPFTVSDDKLGTFQCGTAMSLAPGASITCTKSYAITAADMVALSVANEATATGKFNDNTVTSNEATATIYRQTAALLPTQTTCQMYAAGPSAWPAMYGNFSYQVRGGKINSVSPGVIFYYNTIKAPSASFTLTVAEVNTANWKPLLIQTNGQAILYNADCSKASGVAVTATGTKPYTVTFTVTGAKAGATYYIGIKYTPQNLVGQPVSKSGGKYPTSIYSFSTSINGALQISSAVSIPVKPKR